MDDLAGSINMLTNNMLNAANVVMAYNKDKLDKKFTREMYLQQLNDNRENWDMMNKYNAPSAQMERLQAAGLNPNLIYGSGGVTGTTSMPQGSSSSPYHSPAPQFTISPLSDYLALRNYEKNMQLADVQIDKSRAEADSIRAQTAYTRSQTFGTDLQNAYFQRISDYKIKQEHYAAWNSEFDSQQKAIFAYETAKQTLANLISQGKLYQKQMNLSDGQLSAIFKDMQVKDATIRKIMADTTVSYASAEKIYDDILSQSIHDELDVLSQSVQPFGQSARGQAMNAIFDMTYQEGDVYNMLSSAYNRLRGTVNNRNEMRKSVYPVRTRVSNKFYRGPAPKGWRRFKR